MLRLTLLIMAALPVAASAWVVAPGPSTTLCEPSKRPPEVRRGPYGIEHILEPPKCREIRTGKAPTYHFVGGAMIDSQQTVPEGTPCPLERMRVDHVTYGRVAPELWAVCGKP